MGLDGIELICDIEKQFDITITDNEAMCMLTVNDIVNVVGLKLSMYPENTFIYKQLFLKLKDIFVSLGLKEEYVTINSEIISLIPKEKLDEYWEHIKDKLQLKLPENTILNYIPVTEEDVKVKIFGKVVYKKNKRIRNYTLHTLINYIISLNYKKLIDLSKISDRYEVERVICGIIADKMYIDIHEIELEYQIVRDLGID
ncbi:acyl carrier protein [Apibacter sp. HY039]|uniref:acyl carrier protein n=1 Tax=Apibacter sp. HY039 TaxID=2501476 RepID=UPI000FEB6260|nr:acyl carrier protein [Apibacter sp. HY039]